MSHLASVSQETEPEATVMFYYLIRKHDPREQGLRDKENEAKNEWGWGCSWLLDLEDCSLDKRLSGWVKKQSPVPNFWWLNVYPLGCQVSTISRLSLWSCHQGLVWWSPPFGISRRAGGNASWAGSEVGSVLTSLGAQVEQGPGSSWSHRRASGTQALKWLVLRQGWLTLSWVAAAF